MSGGGLQDVGEVLKSAKTSEITGIASVVVIVVVLSRFIYAPLLEQKATEKDQLITQLQANIAKGTELINRVEVLMDKTREDRSASLMELRELIWKARGGSSQERSQ